MTDVAANLALVRERIDSAARAAGRNTLSVRLVAVSKTKPAALVRAAYAAGQRDFGENYVQEMIAKADELADLPDLRWHAIGHLQRNKVKQALRVASAIHTADSVRLVHELAKRAADAPISESKRLPLGRDGGTMPTDGRLPVFVEVNVGGEAQKNGCSPDDVDTVTAAVETSEALRLVGLMTVPPHTDDPEGARPYFDELVRLRDAHGGPERLPELSMGMTHDLDQAVAAGATWVRIGTAIFGAREPKRD